jgi:hypothetical protein
MGDRLVTFICCFRPTNDRYCSSISRMMRGFRHNGPVSLDVVSAAMRQFKFTSQMEQLGWTDKLYFGSYPKVIASSITQYHLFLDLFAHNPSKALVPTLVVDLGWHTHMLNAEAYQADCMRLFDRYLNHEDKVEEGKLGTRSETCTPFILIYI